LRNPQKKKGGGFPVWTEDDVAALRLITGIVASFARPVTGQKKMTRPL
jgi:hypothetical protein